MPLAPHKAVLVGVGAVLLLVALLVQIGTVPLAGVPCPNLNGCRVGSQSASPALSAVFSLTQSGGQANLTDKSGVIGNGATGWSIAYFYVSWGDGSQSPFNKPGSTVTHVYAPGSYTVAETAYAVGPTISVPCANAITGATHCIQNQTLSGQDSRTITVPAAGGGCSPVCTPKTTYNLSVAFSWSSTGLSAWFTPTVFQTNLTILTQNIVFNWGDGTPSSTGISVLANGTIFHHFVSAGAFAVQLSASGSQSANPSAPPVATATVTHTVTLNNTGSGNGSTGGSNASNGGLTLEPWALVLGLVGAAAIVAAVLTGVTLVATDLTLLAIAALVALVTLLGVL